MTVDLEPIHEDGLTGGHLVELWGVLDDRHTLVPADALRFDVAEDDIFNNDKVVSLLGTPGAVAPDGVPTEARTTEHHVLPEDTDLAAFVEERKRAAPPVPAFDQALLVIEEPVRANGSGTRRTHVITWWRVVPAGDLLGKGELFCTLDVRNGQLEADSANVKVTSAAAGVALRLHGTVTDVAPLVPAVPEPLADIPVTLAGRRAVSGDTGAFVLDARLKVGDEPLAIARSGIDPVELRVVTTAGAGGVVTVAVNDANGNQLGTATTPEPATEATVLDLTLAAPIPVRAHKLRGTVLWPDSRTGDVAANYHGTPLAERHVYVLPLPDAGPVADLAGLRPTSTRDWEALRGRPDVLRSARPGLPAGGERTAYDGLFEVKYVDFSAGKRYFIWSERRDPLDPGDVRTASPDHVVRTFRQELIQMTEPNLAALGNANDLERLHRNLVDHEYNLTRDVVPWGVDVLRVSDLPGGRTLVRPSRASRDRWDGLVALAAGDGEEIAVPANRIVEGLELQVLPLVMLGESEEDRAAVVKRAVKALADAAAGAFPNGYDGGTVPFTLDVDRLPNVINLRDGAWDPLTVADNAKKVELLEQTFIVRPQLGRGRTLRVDQARWHMDALSLADNAFVLIPQATPLVAERVLNAAVAGGNLPPKHVAVLGGVAPMLPGVGTRRVYLAPGHGLYASAQASADPADWDSPRGGWAENAGEDETDLMMASLTASFLLRNGATIHAPRELQDFTTPGVANTAARVFVPQANPDFPRFWQQNPVYYLGAVGDPAVLNDANFPVPAGDKNGHGIDGRVAHIRRLAVAPASIDIVLAPHTNGAAGGSRGTMVEYLNSLPAAGVAGEGNPLGFAFATLVFNETRGRTHLRQYSGGVMTMDNINPVTIKDLAGTFHHWVRRDGGPPVQRQRVAADPGLPAVWAAEPFPDAPGPPLRIPVALSETAFHDNAEDAPLLARAWMRRLVAEGNAIAIDAQLRDSPTAATRDEVRAVLTRLVGQTDAVRALPAGPQAVTAADAQAALRNVADPAAVAADPSYRTFTAAALAAARAETRQRLVEALRDVLAPKAGFTPAQATEIDTFVTGAIVGGAGLAALERPGEPPTRAEAGVFACRAVGIKPASLATAETQDVPAGGRPLLLPTPGATGDEYFTRVETTGLVATINPLGAGDVYRVFDAYLADASWERLDTPQGSDTYELDPGTPLIVVVETRGAAWNAPLEGVKIEVDAGRGDLDLACVQRDGLRAVSDTWALSFRPSKEPAEVSIELFVRHPSRGVLSVGVKKLKLKVREPVALPA